MDSLLPSLITIAICAFFFNSFLSYLYRGTPKVDKGFELIYFKLSYRRKLIRSLTSLPLFIAGVVLVILFSELSYTANLLLIISFMFIWAISMIYNFYKWKQEKVNGVGMN